MSEDDDTVYRLRPRERTAVVLRKPSEPPPLTMSALGSDPDIPVLPPLTPPAMPPGLRFGGSAVDVERHGDRIVLVLPGGARIEGSLEEAATLAAALTVRPPTR